MTQTKRVFILLGMPGVGKGTQAQSMAKAYSLYHIDTGQSLRGEIASGSALGKEAQSYVEKGELVPFDLVLQVIKASMLRITPEQNGYLFDGFPRNLEQAEGLNKILGELNLPIDAVFYLETPYDILFDRLAYRVTCSKCDAKYNIKLNPPTRENACDACGGELVTRKDDRPEVIETRLKAYETETSPLIGYYEERGLLKRINADQSIESVFANIQQEMDRFIYPSSDKMLV
jgi:adenylate kinase